MFSTTSQMKRSLIAVALLLLTVTRSVGSATLPDDKNFNARIVLKLQRYYKSLGTHVDPKVIEQTLKAIDKYKPVYFPGNQVSKQDFIALAMLESEFHQYEIGSCGEVGIFQIMQPNISKHTKNPFDIYTNTRLAMKVLRWKFHENRSYKKSIIAYNGLVYHRGKLSEKYWNSFEAHKELLNELGIE